LVHCTHISYECRKRSTEKACGSMSYKSIAGLIRLFSTHRRLP
jgi:hypothetical protein